MKSERFAHTKELQPQMDIFSVITLFGGLAFFLYGMHLLSSSLEKMVGERNFVQSQDIGKVNKAEIKEAMDFPPALKKWSAASSNVFCVP